MSEPWTMAEFQATIEQCSFEFLKADLDLSFTFADLVETELAINDPRGAQQAFAKAESGYVAIAKLRVHVRGVRRSRITRGLRELRARLDSLKSRLPNQ